MEKGLEVVEEYGSDNDGERRSKEVDEVALYFDRYEE